MSWGHDQKARTSPRQRQLLLVQREPRLEDPYLERRLQRLEQRVGAYANPRQELHHPNRRHPIQAILHATIRHRPWGTPHIGNDSINRHICSFLEKATDEEKVSKAVEAKRAKRALKASMEDRLKVNFMTHVPFLHVH